MFCFPKSEGDKARYMEDRLIGVQPKIYDYGIMFVGYRLLLARPVPYLLCSNPGGFARQPQ